jgi:glycosyltransferase involved in cell wall biosynthesis
MGDIRSIHVQRFVQYFAKNHETHLVSLDYEGDSRADTGYSIFANMGTCVHIIKKKQLLFSPFIARKIVKDINPDLVQCHFLTNYGFLGACTGVHPLVVSAMGDDILLHPFQSMFYNLCVRFALKSADFVTCDGVNSLNNIHSFGVSPSRSEIIYPGIDMYKFHPSKRVLLPYQMVFCPRGFDKIYDVKRLFETIRTVHIFFPSVKFVMAGVGTELEMFKGWVEGSGMKDSVEFLGQIPYEDMPRLMASADVSVTTALSDGGIPVSTIEAMACGTPVVSTDAGDALLWVVEGAGYVVERGWSLKMALAILGILSHPESRKRMGVFARGVVENRQDYNKEMKKIEDMYRWLSVGKS